MNREVKSKSMTTANKIGAALLLGCALGASELATAAGQTQSEPATTERLAREPPAGAPAAPAQGPPVGDSAEVKALQKQLKAVQAQLRELAEQNKALLEHQKVIDREIQQQQQQLLAQQQTAMQAQLSAQAQAGGAGSNSALPDTKSPTPQAPMGASGPLATLAQNIKLWGYGEVYYMNPAHGRERAQADLARAVFGIGYSFDSRTEFNSEYEVEHAVSSASDPGEFEVEQFYVDRQLNDAVTVRAGLFLMPFGLLNEHHEPTNFYGVQRNFVETLIIPSTWREGGFNFHGDTQTGFGWNVGLTTGFDLSKWNFAPEFPQYTTALELEDNDVAPLQSTHQELALANAHDLSQYISLSYFGVPGLTVGGAIFSGKAVSVPAPPNAPIPGNQRVTLWEGHVRWTPDKFDLSALYAHGHISNLAGTNSEFPGSPNPIPSDFYGYYFQAAYDVWSQGDYRLSPFARWEVYNMGSSYEGTTGPDIPLGTTPLTAAPGDYGLWPRDQDRLWTLGANLYITPHVVVKVDYQHFMINKEFTRFDLGLGLNF